jgi:hypothetical protein
MKHDLSLPASPHDTGRGADERRIPRAEPTRAKWAGFVGTALENFDVVIYSTATATVFNKLFFPNVTPATGYSTSSSDLRRRHRPDDLRRSAVSVYGQLLARRCLHGDHGWNLAGAKHRSSRDTRQGSIDRTGRPLTTSA